MVITKRLFCLRMLHGLPNFIAVNVPRGLHLNFLGGTIESFCGTHVPNPKKNFFQHSWCLCKGLWIFEYPKALINVFKKLNFYKNNMFLAWCSGGPPQKKKKRNRPTCKLQFPVCYIKTGFLWWNDLHGQHVQNLFAFVICHSNLGVM